MSTSEDGRFKPIRVVEEARKAVLRLQRPGSCIWSNLTHAQMETNNHCIEYLTMYNIGLLEAEKHVLLTL
jgi:hypothetical protein